MNIAGIDVGNGAPCRIVAELSNAHNGSLDTALRLLDAIKASGADFAKFQAYTPAELVALRGDGPAPAPWDSMTMRDLYTRAQTPHAWFPKLVAHCESIGLPWFASVFGYGSFVLMEALGCPAYKLASLDRGSRKLLAMVKASGKPVIRSSPTPTPDFTLYCPPGYPQPAIGLREHLSRFVGFSYHGTDVHVPLAAAVLGAGMVELHVQLDDEPSALEANVSLNVGTVGKLVAALRGLEGAL